MKRLTMLSIIALCLSSLTSQAHAEKAIFAGGCFWCVESDLEKLEGVRDVVSGYGGGTRENPTYKTYQRGGHREVVEVDFDETIISYDELLTIFLRTVDVTDAGGQFCDRGYGYSTAIHPNNDAQREAAIRILSQAQESLGQQIVTPIEQATTFWPAEEYHQGYYKSQERQLTRFGYVTRAKAYKGYRSACGRDARVQQVWGAQAYQGIPEILE